MHIGTFLRVNLKNSNISPTEVKIDFFELPYMQDLCSKLLQDRSGYEEQTHMYIFAGAPEKNTGPKTKKSKSQPCRIPSMSLHPRRASLLLHPPVLAEL